MSETQERDQSVTSKALFISIWAIESEQQFHIYTQESGFFFGL